MKQSENFLNEIKKLTAEKSKEVQFQCFPWVKVPAQDIVKRKGFTIYLLDWEEGILALGKYEDIHFYIGWYEDILTADDINKAVDEMSSIIESQDFPY